MKESSELSKSIKTTLTDTDLQNVSADLAETFMDSVIRDGLLKDIPIIGTIVGLGKTTLNIKDRLFIKKLIHFLNEIKDIPIEKRKEMISKIDESEDFGIKIGEKLLYIVDKCDDHEKAKLIAKLFAAFLNEKIDYSDFLRASVVIERSMVDDLMWFVEKDWVELEIEESGEWINYGLFEIKPISISIAPAGREDFGDGFRVEGDRIKTQVTYIGKKIREVLK